MIDTRLHSILGDLIPFTPWDGITALNTTPRYRMYAYVARCEMAGFANTDDLRRACALRWLAGKRKVSLPGTKRRKRAAAYRRKLINNLPPELIFAIHSVCTEEAIMIAKEKPKTINALVGAVLRLCKMEPAIVRRLIEIEISGQPIQV